MNTFDLRHHYATAKNKVGVDSHTPAKDTNKNIEEHHSPFVIHFLFTSCQSLVVATTPHHPVDLV